MTRVVGIRGATTAAGNSRDEIIDATKELMERIVASNEVDVEDIAAGWFTTTEDLNAEFPALAARQMGWGNVALLCGHEMKVPDGVDRCIRILLLVNSDKPASEVANVYLKGAEHLRSRGMEASKVSRPGAP